MFINSPCGFTLAVFPYNVTDKKLNSDRFINVMNVCFYNVRYDSFIPVLIPFIENVRIMVRSHGSLDNVSTECFFKTSPKQLAQNVSVKLWYVCKTYPQRHISQSGLSFRALIFYGAFTVLSVQNTVSVR